MKNTREMKIEINEIRLLKTENVNNGLLELKLETEDNG